jgi:hypothetical protein
MIAMVVGVDQVFDRRRRKRLDGGLDLVGERRELAVDHDDGVGADRDRDVAALPHQHVGLVAKVDGLDLDLVPVDQRRRRWRGRRLLGLRGFREHHRCGRQCGQRDLVHGFPLAMTSRFCGIAYA